MANSLGSNPWILDTAASAVLKAHSWKCVTVEWRAPTTLNHTMVLTDKNGHNIVSAVCEAAGQSQLFRLYDAWYDGLILPTLASGTVYIHFK